MNYVEGTIDKDSREQFNMKIAEYYEEILRIAYSNQRPD